MRKTKFLKAFTLAEVLATVVILGVIAAITIPSTLHRVTERQNKTRVRKAMTTYQTLVEKMIIENNIGRSTEALNQWANNDGNCTNARRYLKGSRDGCIFRSADGLWYNITNISETIIGFDNHGQPTNVQNNNIALGDENKAFALVTSFDQNGSIRVQDNTYESNNGDSDTIWATQKVQCYLNNDSCQNLNTHCSCSGDNCCTSHCKGKNICVEKDIACVATRNNTNCAGAGGPWTWGDRGRNQDPWTRCPNITAGDDCTSSRYVYNEGDPRIVQYDGNKTFIVQNNSIDANANWVGSMILTKNDDGTVSFRWDTPYSGGGINEIIYDAQGNPIKFRNYDRDDCTREKCNWEVGNPFDHLDEVAYGGWFDGCATGNCPRSTLKGHSKSDQELIKAEIERLLKQ